MSRTSAQQMGLPYLRQICTECLGKALQISQSSFLSFLSRCWSHLSLGGQVCGASFHTDPTANPATLLERNPRANRAGSSQSPQQRFQSLGLKQAPLGGGILGTPEVEGQAFLAGEALQCLGCLEWGACCADL